MGRLSGCPDKRDFLKAPFLDVSVAIRLLRKRKCARESNPIEGYGGQWSVAVGPSEPYDWEE